MKVGIIGLGNLGSAVAYTIASNGHSVIAWEHDATVVDEVNQQHTNQRYLPDKVFPETLVAVSDIADLYTNTELLFVTLPSRFIEPVLKGTPQQPALDVGIVNMSKGLDAETGKTAFQILSDIFPHHPKAMLAGPSLANEFVRGVVTGVMAASDSPALLAAIGDALNNARFAVAVGDDALGVELGGILKNIYALGLGAFEGRDDKGLNFIGAYLTQALMEMQTLGVALGAKPESFMQLSGVGDLIATAMSPQSHNYTMGTLVAKGMDIPAIEKQLAVLPEGYNSLQVALTLAEQQGIALPLAELLQQLIHQQLDIDTFMHRFTSALRHEV